MTIRRTVLLACASLLVPVATAHAGNGNGGNSEGARACQHGGWEDLYREDGSAFADQGECVSYAARGGELTLSYPAARTACASRGGTFGVGGPNLLAPVDGWVVEWVCNDMTPNIPLDGLSAACFAEGDPGQFVMNARLAAPSHATCWHVGPSA
jgi:hypothetical protein